MTGEKLKIIFNQYLFLNSHLEKIVNCFGNFDVGSNELNLYLIEYVFSFMLNK